MGLSAAHGLAPPPFRKFLDPRNLRLGRPSPVLVCRLYVAFTNAGRASTVDYLRAPSLRSPEPSPRTSSVLLCHGLRSSILIGRSGGGCWPLSLHIIHKISQPLALITAPVPDLRDSQPCPNSSPLRAWSDASGPCPQTYFSSFEARRLLRMQHAEAFPPFLSLGYEARRLLHM